MGNVPFLLRQNRLYFIYTFSDEGFENVDQPIQTLLVGCDDVEKGQLAIGL